MEVVCDIHRNIDMVPQSREWRCWRGRCRYSTDGSVYKCNKCRSLPEELQDEQYVCLQVLSTPSLLNWKRIYFLVLKRSATVEGAFERLGVAKMTDAMTVLGNRQREGHYDRDKAWDSRKVTEGKVILPFLLNGRRLRLFNVDRIHLSYPGIFGPLIISSLTSRYINI